MGRQTLAPWTWSIFRPQWLRSLDQSERMARSNLFAMRRELQRIAKGGYNGSERDRDIVRAACANSLFFVGQDIAERQPWTIMRR